MVCAGRALVHSCMRCCAGTFVKKMIHPNVSWPDPTKHQAAYRQAYTESLDFCPQQLRERKADIWLGANLPASHESLHTVLWTQMTKRCCNGMLPSSTTASCRNWCLATQCHATCTSWRTQRCMNTPTHTDTNRHKEMHTCSTCAHTVAHR